MGTIGGLDVAYGAQLQIVRTNVLLVEVATANVTEHGGKNLLNIAQQGLPPLIAPDFIAFTDDADADVEDTGWSAASIFQDSRDVATTATTFTAADNHGLLRDIRECPLAPGGVTPIAATTALGTEVGFTGGKFALEAVLSVGAIELTTLDGASPAATIPAPYLLTEATPNTFAVAGTNGLVNGIDSCNIHSRAMELAFENSQVNATMAAAGIPAGSVSHLDLSGIGEHITAGFAGTGADWTAGDLATLNAGSVTMGQMNTTEATNLAWDDVDDEIANNAAIISVVSLARVA
jgi:hypothetical protein